MKGKLAVFLFVISVLVPPAPSSAQSCEPPGYTHYCASFCGFCEGYGACCRFYACGDPIACPETYQYYCVQSNSGPDCYDGYGDGCCEGGGGLF